MVGPDIQPVSFWKQMMLTAALFALESCLVFEQLYTLLCLQYLGVPVSLCTIHGVFSGIITLTLIPVNGYIVDKGTNTKKRKMMSIILGCLSLLGGLSLILAGNTMKTLSSMNLPNSNDDLMAFPLLNDSSVVEDLQDANLHELTSNSKPRDISSLSVQLSSKLWSSSTEIPTTYITRSSVPGPSKYSSITNGTFLSSVLTLKESNHIIGTDNTTITTGVSNLTRATVEPQWFNTTKSPVEPNITFIPDGVNVTATDYIPLSGFLGILGFALIDIGCDFCTPNVRAFLLDHTSKTQHSKILVASTLVSSIAGTIMSCLGMFDIPNVIERNFNVDGTATTFILLCCFLSALVVSGFTCTIITARNLVNDSKRRSNHSLGDNSNEKSLLLKQTTEKEMTYTSFEDIFPRKYYEPNVRRNVITSKVDGSNFLSHVNSTGLEITQSQDNMSNVPMHGVLKSMSSQSLEDLNEKYEDNRFSFLQTSSTSFGFVPSEELFSTTKHNSHDKKLHRDSKKSSFLNRRLVIVMISTFFSLHAMLAMTMTISTILTIGIYNGDPDAPPGSEGNDRYQKGLQVAAIGSVFFYLSYTVTSALNHRLFHLISERAQYILFHVLLIAAAAGLVLTKRVEVFYVVMIAIGPYRTCTFTLSYLLANKYSQDESTLDHSSTHQNQAKSGRVMALIGFFLPFGYVFEAGLAGPLMAATNVWAVVIYSCVANAIAASIFSLLYFV